MLERFGVADFATIDAGWQTLLGDDPELAREYRVLLDAQRASLRGAPTETSGQGALDGPAMSEPTWRSAATGRPSRPPR